MPQNMPPGLKLDALAEAVAEIEGFAGIAARDLAPLKVKGLAHDHVEVKGRGVLLRVPKQSQFALSAADNLAYQAACFARVSASGQAPRLHGVIAPRPRVPMGALLVDCIAGRPPRLPKDLPALAACMARVHALPLPPGSARPPLANHTDPVGGALKEVEAQVAFLDEAGLEPEARAEIEDELAWGRAFGRETAGTAQPLALVLTDTHPGNFLIDRDAQAFIVDLEKALYGSPGTDLAHATLYSSTTWDLDTYAELNLEQLGAYYRHYLSLLEPAFAAHLRPWLVPMRRVTMLRAITWCAKWQVLNRQAALAAKETAASTEDWSAENSDPALIAHVADRVDTYLSAPILQRIRAEWLGNPGLGDLI
jgi:hypothetical protein